MIARILLANPYVIPVLLAATFASGFYTSSRFSAASSLKALLAARDAVIVQMRADQIEAQAIADAAAREAQMARDNSTFLQEATRDLLETFRVDARRECLFSDAHRRRLRDDIPIGNPPANPRAG
jgi:hypothetical protein